MGATVRKAKTAAAAGVSFELPYRRGVFCARLRGPDPRYQLLREFQQARTVKRDGGRLVFTLQAGWYETRERWAPPGEGRCYWRVDGLGIFPLPESARPLLGVISAGPLPGEPGCWDGELCQCGARVESFDSNGFPWCQGCRPETPMVPASMPVTA